MASAQEIKELLDKFQETLQNWPKDGGLFIDLMGEKLKQLELSFMKDISTQLPADSVTKKNKIGVMQEGQREIYVELYQMDGDNMDRWVNTLNSIGLQGISRPIYDTETDVCSMIRNKPQKNKEGYAIVKIDSKNIINNNSAAADREGRKLLHVKPGSLQPNNITRFVHISGQYLWQGNKLIKLDLPSPILEKK